MVSAATVDAENQPKRASANPVSPLTRLFSVCSAEQAREFYTPVRRSVRIHGHSTTIRLEQAYWSVMEDLAEKEGTSIAGLITKVHDHCQFSDQKNRNCSPWVFRKDLRVVFFANLAS
ncbi:MAG: ribbon-helix-helix domain-containing protein, partial [Proteobacteria bacterium]|nr:ribbon-helix-helix domain-containing protein [Pseudomonadota bacterium]